MVFLAMATTTAATAAITKMTASSASAKGETRSMMRGAFIVVEGLDRAGKSTQVAQLAQAIGARAIKFPGASDLVLTRREALH